LANIEDAPVKRCLMPALTPSFRRFPRRSPPCWMVNWAPSRPFLALAWTSRWGWTDREEVGSAGLKMAAESLGRGQDALRNTRRRCEPPTPDIRLSRRISRLLLPGRALYACFDRPAGGARAVDFRSAQAIAGMVSRQWLRSGR